MKIHFGTLLIITLGTLGIFFYINNYNEIKGLATSIINPSQPVAVIIPHHDIVKEKRKELLERVRSERPVTSTIILLSPDHFSSTQHSVTMANQDWKIGDNILQHDRVLGSKLAPILNTGNGIVANDHGVTNILADIVTLWPNSRVVPILLGQQIKPERLDVLKDLLASNCGYDCLLIASVDFSHYLPYELADIHDINSLHALSTLNLERISDLEVDSTQSLYILTSLTRVKGSFEWNLFTHTNSTKLANFPDAESTSHILGFYKRGKLSSYNKPFTFTLGKNLEKYLNLDSLGERFFYGTDLINTSLENEYIPTPGINFKSGNKSTILYNNEKLEITLGEDLAVAGYIEENYTHILLLPLVKTNNKSFLIRGEKKLEFTSKLLSTLQNDHRLTIDLKRGTIDINKL